MEMSSGYLDRTVVYIEDNYYNRRLARKLLQMRGYKVAEAYDGPSGLALVRVLRPRVVLLDFGLPGMDGVEVLNLIKRDPALRDTVVIALTASAMAGDRERFIEAGCDDYISKPFAAHELIDKVGSYLEQ